MATNTQSEKPRPCPWDVLELPGWKGVEGDHFSVRGTDLPNSAVGCSAQRACLGAAQHPQKPRRARGGGGEREYQLPRRSVCFGRDPWVTQERGKTTPVLRHLQPSTEKNRSEVRKVQGSGEGLVMKCIIK